ncbi:hypothetical protein GGR34_003690 [Microvirga flocculans]|uniref:UrcA family protein n=1 Tax=Microvirga flocculans TaxID=217168 RepID=A0A7W6IIA6_9HYPH|nr:hypothetical protein [Microvirga flocculans]MBB4042005.1 hypothetical protein [Microvirga flocculans]
MPFRPHALVLLAAALGWFSGPAVAQSTEYKVVDAADLSVSARKYADRDIEVRDVRCYYADIGDYRCVTRESVSIFAASIAPLEAETAIKDNCDAIKVALTSPKCRVALRFRYSAEQVGHDIISGYQKRTVIKTGMVRVGFARKR